MPPVRRSQSSAARRGRPRAAAADGMAQPAGRSQSVDGASARPARGGRTARRGRSRLSDQPLRSAAADGATPPFHFENSLELQGLIAAHGRMPVSDAASTSTSRDSAPPARDNAPPARDSAPPARDSAPSVRDNQGDWERSVQARLDGTDRMLREMHAMLRSVTGLPAPLVADCLPDASAIQPSAASGGLPIPAVPLSSAVQSTGPLVTSQGGPPAPAFMTAATRPTANMLTVPWPNVDRILDGAPAPSFTMRGEASSFASSSLPIYAHVAEKTRLRIWEGEAIDLGSLLPDRADNASYSLSVQPDADGQRPMVCVAHKPKQPIGNFQRWLKAFEIYMSVVLLQPCNVSEAPDMLKYISTVRNLAERGGNWRLYDETFRSLRTAQGWRWDTVHWELWLNAQPGSSRDGGASPNTPFQGKGRRAQPSDGVCFAFNRGRQCRQPCRFSHKCKLCGAQHPAFKCHMQKVNPTRSVATRPANK